MKHSAKTTEEAADATTVRKTPTGIHSRGKSADADAHDKTARNGTATRSAHVETLMPAILWPKKRFEAIQPANTVA